MSEPTSFSVAQVVAMERAAARAWPARDVVSVAGWDVRLSGGGSRRANSVLPIAFDGTAIGAAIARVEALYRAQGTRAYFQVSSASTPSNLDEVLAAQGYSDEDPCLLMAKRLAPSQYTADVDVSEAPSADWLSIYTEPLDATRRRAAPGVLAAVPAPRAFLLIRRDGQPISSALAVVSPDAIALVECVATRTDSRRSGGADAAMDALEAWVWARGARIAALQVVAGNAAAISLYQRRGYQVAGRYHYRWRNVV